MMSVYTGRKVAIETKHEHGTKV